MTDRLRLFAAFAVVYIVWGSTFLAIKVGIETMPPFYMMAFRFGVAGILILGWTIWRREKPATLKQWFASFQQSLLLIVLGTGIVAWAEERVSSGMAALILAITPLWMTIFYAMTAKGSRPGRDGIIGLTLGLFGMFLLIGPSQFLGGEGSDPLGVGIVLLSSVCWAAGSVRASYLESECSAFQSTAQQMILGAIVLAVIGFVCGETVTFSEISVKSASALLYLVSFGSLLVFPTYLWLARNASPPMVATHAYINPVIALILGYVFADELVTTRTILAAAIIVLSVVFITHDQGRKKPNKRRARRKRRLKLQSL